MDTGTTDSLLMTGREVEHSLNISKSLRLRLQRDGVLPFVRLGRAVRYIRKGVMTLLKEWSEHVSSGELDSYNTD